MRNSILPDMNEIGFKEEFIRLRADTTAKIKFSSRSLPLFWASQLQTCSTVAMMALEVVLSFTAMYQLRFVCQVWWKTNISIQNECETRH